MNMSMKKQDNEVDEMHRHAGDLFEDFFIKLVASSFDKDTRKITDRRSSFADMSTPCRVSVELKSRKWTRGHSCLTRAKFLHDNHFKQIQAGLEFASRSGSKYAFIVGVHEFVDVRELLELQSDMHAFIKAYKCAHVLLGDCDGVEYRVYDIVNLLANLNNESFKQRLTDGYLGNVRPLDIKVNLGLELDPNRPEWSDEKWTSYFKQTTRLNKLTQDLMVFNTQREFAFSELMYDSVMLEDSTRQHNRRSTFGSDLVLIKSLDVSNELKDSLKIRLKNAGLKDDRIQVLNPEAFFIAMTLVHFGAKYRKKDKRRQTVQKVLRTKTLNLPMQLWNIPGNYNGSYSWLIRFHEILESNHVIQNYILIDPVTFDFKGMPHIKWTHSDHVNALLNSLDDVLPSKPDQGLTHGFARLMAENKRLNDQAAEYDKTILKLIKEVERMKKVLRWK